MKNIISSLIGQQFLINGRVQGVFYRRFAKNTATALAVTGWVCNLANGNVEIQAFGTEEQLKTYCTQLWQGPPAAKVKDIAIQTIAWEAHPDFQIKE